MQDMVIKGTGNSRFLKSVENFKELFPNYDAFAAAFASGILPVDFNGINPDGITQMGTPYAKATVLTDETAALFGLDSTAVPDDVLGAIGNGFSRIVSGTVTGSSAATNDNPNKITFPFYPKLLIVSNSVRKVHPDNYNGESMARNWFFWIDGVTKDHVWVKSSNYGTYYSRHFSVDEKTLSWWQDQPSDGTINGAVVGSYVAFG